MPRSVVAVAAALLGAALTSCRVSPRVVGLRPVSPPVNYGTAPSDFFRRKPPHLLIGLAESREPLLKWKAFPQQRSSNSVLRDATNITYDLRIWHVKGADGALVYERLALPQPEHRVETRLFPDSVFCWTVRARFSVDGYVRVTPWSFSLYPASRGLVASPQRIEEVGYANYYSFRTPAY